jgi:pimeloyl-ACP methyl ester carboxylesterase
VNVNTVYAPRAIRRGRAIALHCSGAGASQWRHLAEVLGGRYEVLAPEHYGCESSEPWTGEHAFTLADEAVRAITLIDQSEEKVHLVGHSYGGGVALHMALARPDRIASMALYEPSAFHLLRHMGGPGVAAYAEIIDLARDVSQGIVTGDYRGAVATFIEYWNGPGAWEAMRPAAQNALIRWAPKAPLDFRALIDDATPASVYRALNFPVLILRGEHAPTPTRLVAEGLLELLSESQLKVVDGAGHMGPFTHAAEVSALIMKHVVSAELDTQAPRRRAHAA